MATGCRIRALACSVIACVAFGANLPTRVGPVAPDLSNRSVYPLSDSAKVNVFVFARIDCPVTNRYAPELKRVAQEFADKGVKFWLVYPDRSETAEEIQKHIEDYGFPGTPLRDPDRVLERYAKATVAPEAAVFDAAGRLRYHGRIDDRWVAFGKSRQEASRHDLEIAISEVLEGRAVSVAETRAIGCYLADLQ
ncbi:MAG: redoxin domain-containing protein [Bryobacteraceae bacterium]